MRHISCEPIKERRIPNLFLKSRIDLERLLEVWQRWKWMLDPGKMTDEFKLIFISFNFFSLRIISKRFFVLTCAMSLAL